MNGERSEKTFTLTAVSIFALIALVLGVKPLVDVDIGWHVASGLWMLEHRTVPLADPFSMLQTEFVAYSWLPELAMGLVFKAFGFRGLQALQALLIVLSVPAIWAACGNRAPLLAKPLACAAGIVLISPTWHLRPQLLSVILFLCFIALGERRALSFFRAAALTVLWANIHIYWVLGPYVYLAYAVLPALSQHTAVRRRVCELLMLCGAGFLTPYTWRSYKVIWLYMFRHEEAKALIREFQPLGIEHGYLLIVYLLILILACVFRKRTVTRPQSLVLAVPLAFQSALQIKFLPLFGASVLPLLSSELIPPFLKNKAHNTSESRAKGRLAAAAAGLLICTSLCMIDTAGPLTVETQELFRLTAELPQTSGELRILNHFDDGGWISLALMVAGKKGRVAIDGRTLVMGGKRIGEFDRLRRGDDICRTLERWGPFDAAFLQTALAASKDLTKCDSRWLPVKETNTWTVFSFQS